MTVTPQRTARPLISVHRATSGDDFDDASALIGELQAWVREHMGVELTAHQPALGVELEALAEHFGGPSSAIFVGRVDAVATGCVAVRCTDGTAELKRMFVRADARGLGLGDLLVEQVVEFARARRCRSVWLETARGAMDAAIAVYARHGFAITAEPSALGIDHVVVMRRELANRARSASATHRHPARGIPAPV